MSVRLYTRIATLIAVVAVAATGASYASADSSKGIQIPANLANFQEPGSTGFVPAAEVTVASTADRGLDWVSAVVGAGAALGLAIAGAGAFVAVRKRRTLAHA